VHILKLIFDDLTVTKKKVTKAHYNKEIDAAVKRVRSGKSLSNEQVMSKMDKW
jgi:type II secretory pathway component PulF